MVYALAALAAKEGRAWRRDARSFVATLSTALRADPDVLLLPQGPDAGTSEQPGHPAIRAALERTAGVLTLCGHVHWPAPLAARRKAAKYSTSMGVPFC